MSMPKSKIMKTKGDTKKKTKKIPNSLPVGDSLPHLTFYAEDDNHDPVKVGDVRINFDMIVRRNLPESMRDMSHEDIVSALHAVSHVRLDRENITHIDNLEMLGTKVTNLYLQQNRVLKLENLECLLNLQFLTLSGNQISCVENLRSLDELKFLDLSYNQIDRLDVAELPRSLVILSLEGNRCTRAERYRERLLSALPNLKQLDGQDLRRTDDGQTSYMVSEEWGDADDGNVVLLSDGGGEAVGGNVHYPHRSLEEYMIENSVQRTDLFSDVIDAMRDRSRRRVAEMDEQHLRHKDILSKIREDSKFKSKTNEKFF